MNIIHKNPFRILGLMANSTERELQKQIAIVKRFSEIGKSASFVTDYKFLEPITRSLDDIQSANSKIEQGHKKRGYALFWLVNHTKFDEIAFNNLNENNTEKAIYIWNQTLKDAVTEKNYTSYLNLSTLYAALSVTSNGINLPMLEKSFIVKSQVLNSESLILFSELIGSNSKSVDVAEVSKRYVDDAYDWLKPYISKSHGITLQDFLSLFEPYPETIRNYISNKFIEIPLANIESNIEKTEAKRKATPEKGKEFGEELYYNNIEDLKKIKTILGETNIQYQMLANNLAGEILQCGINFYNVFMEADSDFDPGDEALSLCFLSKSIGVTGHLTERIEDTIETIQEWVDSKSEREQLRDIGSELTSIGEYITSFQRERPSINVASLLIVECKPKLKAIKAFVGMRDELYINICDAVVNNALGMVVAVINDVQERLNRDNLSATVTTLSRADNLLEFMILMDMSNEVRRRLEVNARTISSTKAALQKSSGACYIATMAYGSYDHPQVLFLREFRDNTLTQSILGRTFIKVYYAISPSLVSVLKNRYQINKLIRYLLNMFVRSLKNGK